MYMHVIIIIKQESINLGGMVNMMKLSSKSGSEVVAPLMYEFLKRFKNKILKALLTFLTFKIVL